MKQSFLLFLAAVLLLTFMPHSADATAACADDNEPVKTFTKQIVKPGNGMKPTKGSMVTVHCTGYGKNRDLAVKFWSTKDAGQRPFTFQIGMGQVIKAWDEGVSGMELGEIAIITSSPSYAYGDGGFPAWGILPQSILKFEIEILDIK